MWKISHIEWPRIEESNFAFDFLTFTCKQANPMITSLNFNIAWTQSVQWWSNIQKQISRQHLVYSLQIIDITVPLKIKESRFWSTISFFSVSNSIIKGHVDNIKWISFLKTFTINVFFLFRICLGKSFEQWRCSIETQRSTSQTLVTSQENFFVNFFQYLRCNNYHSSI